MQPKERRETGKANHSTAINGTACASAGLPSPCGGTQHNPVFLALHKPDIARHRSLLSFLHPVASVPSRHILSYPVHSRRGQHPWCNRLSDQRTQK
jgi:hypothetical protein